MENEIKKDPTEVRSDSKNVFTDSTELAKHLLEILKGQSFVFANSALEDAKMMLPYHSTVI